jgi:hypothetical protein
MDHSKPFYVKMRTMTSSQFGMLSKLEKEKYILEKGRLIGMRQEPEFIIRLYQMDSFYAELYYHQIKNDAVYIRCFTDTNALDPYLNGIDLGFINYL